jgi:hypothetical protein
MHYPQRGRQSLVADSAKPSARDFRAPIEMDAQDFDEHQSREIGRVDRDNHVGRGKTSTNYERKRRTCMKQREYRRPTNGTLFVNSRF